MSFWSEFKAFAIKGNVIDLAVGVVIGGAFGKIVSSIVDDIIMPAVSMITDSDSFTNKFYVLRPGENGVRHFRTLEDAKKAGANVIAYGHMIQTVVDFAIISFCIFLLVRTINAINRKREALESAAKPEVSSTDALLIEIRDLLKKQQK